MASQYRCSHTDWVASCDPSLVRPGEVLDRYRHHKDPAIRLLAAIDETLPLRSVERGITTCAILYLEGEKMPGYSVQTWWKQQDAVERTQPVQAGISGEANKKGEPNG